MSGERVDGWPSSLVAPDFLLQRPRGRGTLALALGPLPAPPLVLDTTLVASPRSRSSARLNPTAQLNAAVLPSACAEDAPTPSGRCRQGSTLRVVLALLTTAGLGLGVGTRPALAQGSDEPAAADTADAQSSADEDEDEDEAPRPRPERVYTEEDEDFETLPEADDPWVMQVAARTGLGFGTTLGDLRREFVWDSHLRAEFMFTKRGDEHFSIGPSFELRGADMDTFEVAAGLSVLLPVARGYPIDVSAQVGYAVRREQRFGGSAPIFVGTIAGGYRSFNFHHWWQTSLQIYAQVRMDITEPRNLAFMMGVEIDLAQAVVVPALMIRMKVRGGDPDELEEDEDEDADADGAEETD